MISGSSGSFSSSSQFECHTSPIAQNMSLSTVGHTLSNWTQIDWKKGSCLSCLRSYGLPATRADPLNPWLTSSTAYGPWIGRPGAAASAVFLLRQPSSSRCRSASDFGEALLAHGVRGPQRRVRAVPAVTLLWRVAARRIAVHRPRANARLCPAGTHSSPPPSSKFFYYRKRDSESE